MAEQSTTSPSPREARLVSLLTECLAVIGNPTIPWDQSTRDLAQRVQAELAAAQLPSAVLSVLQASGTGVIESRETERRWLLARSSEPVIQEARAEGSLERQRLVEQRYLSSTGKWSIRVRRTENLDGTDPRFFMTMKRKVTKMTCIEIEFPIDAETFARMAANAGHAIRKVRSYIRHAGRLLELDVFLNPELNGLELVEVEIESEDARIDIPAWFEREVTGIKRFKNAFLARALRA